MAVRRAKAYSKKKITSFTRKSQKVKHLNYIKAVPAQKISKFNMGNIPKYNKGEFKNVIEIISLMHVQIRDLALEAARQFVHNQIEKHMPVENYYMSCRGYPHQVIRNNKIYSGGSKGERVQSGMAHSYGTAEGRSAVFRVGQPIFVIAFENKKDTAFLRELCRSASPKLPGAVKILYTEIK